MDTIGEMKYVLYMEVSLFKGFSKLISFNAQEWWSKIGYGWLPCEPGVIMHCYSNRSDVIEHGFLWCVASTTLSRQLGTTRIFYACSHKDYILRITLYLICYQDGWLYRLCSLHPVVYFIYS